MESKISVTELKNALEPELDRLLEEVALAVSQRPYGRIIARQRRAGSGCGGVVSPAALSASINDPATAD